MVGGLFTSVLFSVGRTVIGLYLSKSAVGSAYGAAGSLIVLLAWVYYSAVIVFTGSELTKAMFAEDKKFSLNKSQLPARSQALGLSTNFSAPGQP